MAESHIVTEVNLLRNVQGPDGKSAVSKEPLSLKRKFKKENRKKETGHGMRLSLLGMRHSGYENEVLDEAELEASVDITV